MKTNETMVEIDGIWVPSLPVPYPHKPIAGLWRRLTGWRDQYGRPATIMWKCWERDL